MDSLESILANAVTFISFIRKSLQRAQPFTRDILGLLWLSSYFTRILYRLLLTGSKVGQPSRLQLVRVSGYLPPRKSRGRSRKVRALTSVGMEPVYAGAELESSGLMDMPEVQESAKFFRESNIYSVMNDVERVVSGAFTRSFAMTSFPAVGSTIIPSTKVTPRTKQTEFVKELKSSALEPSRFEKLEQLEAEPSRFEKLEQLEAEPSRFEKLEPDVYNSEEIARYQPTYTDLITAMVDSGRLAWDLPMVLTKASAHSFPNYGERGPDSYGFGGPVKAFKGILPYTRWPISGWLKGTSPIEAAHTFPELAKFGVQPRRSLSLDHNTIRTVAKVLPTLLAIATQSISGVLSMKVMGSSASYSYQMTPEVRMLRENYEFSSIMGSIAEERSALPLEPVYEMTRFRTLPFADFGKLQSTQWVQSGLESVHQAKRILPMDMVVGTPFTDAYSLSQFTRSASARFWSPAVAEAGMIGRSMLTLGPRSTDESMISLDYASQKGETSLVGEELPSPLGYTESAHQEVSGSSESVGYMSESYSPNTQIQSLARYAPIQALQLTRTRYLSSAMKILPQILDRVGKQALGYQAMMAGTRYPYFLGTLGSSLEGFLRERGQPITAQIPRQGMGNSQPFTLPRAPSVTNLEQAQKVETNVEGMISESSDSKGTRSSPEFTGIKAMEDTGMEVMKEAHLADKDELRALKKKIEQILNEELRRYGFQI